MSIYSERLGQMAEQLDGEWGGSGPRKVGGGDVTTQYSRQSVFPTFRLGDIVTRDRESV